MAILSKSGKWEDFPTATKEPTRAQMLNDEVTHREYVSAIVETSGFTFRDGDPMVARCQRSTDKWYNDVPLHLWDNYYLDPHQRKRFIAALVAHGQYPKPMYSLSDKVSFLKAAMRNFFAKRAC